MNIIIINIVSVAVFVGVLALLMPLLRPGKSQIHIPDRFKSVGLRAAKREITRPVRNISRTRVSTLRTPGLS